MGLIFPNISLFFIWYLRKKRMEFLNLNNANDVNYITTWVNCIDYSLQNKFEQGENNNNNSDDNSDNNNSWLRDLDDNIISDVNIKKQQKHDLHNHARHSVLQGISHFL
jgi:hypothetical protein